MTPYHVEAVFHSTLTVTHVDQDPNPTWILFDSPDQTTTTPATALLEEFSLLLPGFSLSTSSGPTRETLRPF